MGGGVIDQLPQDEPVEMRVAAEGVADDREEGPESIFGGSGSVEAAHAAGDELAHQGIEYSLVEALLVAEVVVQEGAVHAGLGGDVLDGGGDEPLGGETGLGCSEDLITGGGDAHPRIINQLVKYWQAPHRLGTIRLLRRHAAAAAPPVRHVPPGAIRRPDPDGKVLTGYREGLAVLRGRVAELPYRPCEIAPWPRFAGHWLPIEGLAGGRVRRLILPDR